MAIPVREPPNFIKYLVQILKQIPGTWAPAMLFDENGDS